MTKGSIGLDLRKLEQEVGQDIIEFVGQYVRETSDNAIESILNNNDRNTARIELERFVRAIVYEEIRKTLGRELTKYRPTCYYKGN